MRRSPSAGKIAHPRVLWDGGEPIGESSCVSCGHCVTVCPCNALMEKSMLGEAGYFTALPEAALESHDRRGEGYRAGGRVIGRSCRFPRRKRPCASRASSRTKTVCTYCGVGCSFDIWTKDRHILKVEPAHGPANGISTCIKGKFGWDYVEQS